MYMPNFLTFMFNSLCEAIAISTEAINILGLHKRDYINANKPHVKKNNHGFFFYKLFVSEGGGGEKILLQYPF